jgi:rhodanese-related sulfurtransferase
MNKFILSPTLRRILLEALILCILSAAVGLSLNFKLIFNAFSEKPVSAPVSVRTVVKEVISGNVGTLNIFPVSVELDKLDELLAAGALLVDSRNYDDYQRSHLAGAISLPLGLLESNLENFMKQVPRDRILVIYCSGYGCPDSFKLGVRLLKNGYTEVLVYEGGFPEWRNAGRPLAGMVE